MRTYLKVLYQRWKGLFNSSGLSELADTLNIESLKPSAAAKASTAERPQKSGCTTQVVFMVSALEKARHEAGKDDDSDEDDDEDLGDIHVTDCPNWFKQQLAKINPVHTRKIGPFITTQKYITTLGADHLEVVNLKAAELITKKIAIVAKLKDKSEIQKNWTPASLRKNFKEAVNAVDEACYRVPGPNIQMPKGDFVSSAF